MRIQKTKENEREAVIVEIEVSTYIGALIGGGIGFISSIGILVITRLMDRKGKLHIYCKRIGHGDRSWGFQKSNNGAPWFVVPLYFELMNTANTTRVIRNVQMLLYHQGEKIADMKQIEGATTTHTTNGKVNNIEDHSYGSENNSYSFVLPPRSIQKINCEYIFARPSSEEIFDEIKIAYYDERDKLILKHLAEYEGNWTIRDEQVDDDWIKIV